MCEINLMFHFSYRDLGDNNNFPLCKAFSHFSLHSKAAALNFECLLCNMSIPWAIIDGILEKLLLALTGVGLVGWVSLQSESLMVGFPVRAQAWAAGRIPSRRPVGGNPTLRFLFLSFSFPPPLSQNKIFRKKKR